MQLENLHPEKRIVVIGAGSLDVVGQPIAALKTGSPNPAQVRTSFGGVARNVAENLARLGQSVTLVTAVGKDDLGDKVLDHTANAGVDVSLSLRLDDASTATYIAILDEAGNSRYALDDMTILSHITSAYLRALKPLFADCQLIFVDCNLSPAALRTVFSLAQRLKIPICADATSITLGQRILRYIPQLFLLTANRLEAAALLGLPPILDVEDALAAARQFVRQGVEIVVIPIGEGGVCYATSQTSGHVPAVITRVVNRIGAGDALTATTVFGILNEIDIDESIRLGVTAASLTLTHSGAVSPHLTLELLYDKLVI